MNDTILIETLLFPILSTLLTLFLCYKMFTVTDNDDDDYMGCPSSEIEGAAFAVFMWVIITVALWMMYLTKFAV